jgi:hypothetical protein
MMMSLVRRLIAATILILLALNTGAAQALYVPTTNDVYSFLQRMESRGLLPDYRDAARPLSRLTLAAHLQRLALAAEQFTRVDREIFEFYKTEYQFELLTLENDPEPSETRWHLFSKTIDRGILNLDINYELGTTSVQGVRRNLRAQGLRFSGYAFGSMAYYFNFVDHRETGKGIDRTKLHSAEPGMVPVRDFPNAFEYDEIDAQMSVRIGPADLMIAKMKNAWGYGPQGSVIFSEKAPSYPLIHLRIPLSKDIDFVYFHADLHSNDTDSLRSYTQTYPNSAFAVYRTVDKLKYLAAHQIEISLFNGVDVSLGESIVYSDRGPLLIYMVPIMFFKAAEHYNRDRDNAQMFGSLDLNVVRDVNARLSLFIDEINTDDFFNGGKSRRQVAFSLGVRTFDLPWKNVEFAVDYARCNPWVYNHKYSAITFTNNGYDLGHWIGQNADLLTLELAFRPMRALRASLHSEVYRKGGMADPSYQYMIDGGNLPFLYGTRHEERSFGLRVKSEPLRDLFLEGHLFWRSTIDDALGSQNRNKSPEFALSARLGVW